ncbi:MAG: GNAT family N-acetyltransferase [Lachnospiraceae bacterium]|nr:GNAT family N-acetyltransferase [Lachnospiraceae bacterium]
MSEYKIRDVRIEDASRLVEIYSYYVSNTAVSFEYDAPSVSEFENRIKHTIEAYPYLVCEKDNKDRRICLCRCIQYARSLHMDGYNIDLY